MRIQMPKKVAANPSREDRLREARASAPTLRSVLPSAASVHVQLRFTPETAPLAAPQGFQLYPPARAFFVYPCPHGDCDGVYDLQAEALRILSREETSVSGVVECAGVRSRNGLQRQPCGLHVSYIITCEEAQAPNRSSGAPRRS
jgi:hypothetical protein